MQLLRLNAESMMMSSYIRRAGYVLSPLLLLLCLLSAQLQQESDALLNNWQHPTGSDGRLEGGTMCCFHLEARTAVSDSPGFILDLPAADLQMTTSAERFCLDVGTGQLEGRSGRILSQGTWVGGEGDGEWEGEEWDGPNRYGRTRSGSCGFGIRTTRGGRADEAHLVYRGRQKFILPLYAGGPTSAAQPADRGGHGIEVQLLLRGATSQCDLLITDGRPGGGGGGDVLGRVNDVNGWKSFRVKQRGVELAATVTGYPTTSLDAVSSAPTCDVAGSVPSILPRALFVGPVNGTKYNRSRGFSADINPMESTVFQFDLGELLRTPPSTESLEVGMCALQFRLPVCTQLPDGYPCYQFSGMEQEVLQRSGMRIEFVDGSDRPVSWAAVPLVQIWPGEDSLVGTFACGAVGPRGVAGQGGVVSWLAESVNGFELSFLQASDGGYQNGVGLFVVNCR